MILSSDNIGQIVSFSVYPSAIIGTNFQRVKVLSFPDADDASVFVDPAALHATVFPTLPGGTPNDPKKYPWVKIELENGTKTVLGLPWIDPTTVVVNTSEQVRVTLSGAGVSAASIPRIRDALIIAGFNELAFETL